ncbi:MAG: type VII toxin-antitoxin system HepT family RNase toxin [Aeromonas sp.]
MADNGYVTALSASLALYQADLAEIKQLLIQRSLSNLEYRAAERSLQVTIEACIGVAKHWAKGLTGRNPQDAYQAFEWLCQQGQVAESTLINWRKIIGLRNALVHDYLNIEPEIIRSVIRLSHTDQLFSFADAGLAWLAEQARVDYRHQVADNR